MQHAELPSDAPSSNGEATPDTDTPNRFHPAPAVGVGGVDDSARADAPHSSRMQTHNEAMAERRRAGTIGHKGGLGAKARRKASRIGKQPAKASAYTLLPGSTHTTCSGRNFVTCYVTCYECYQGRRRVESDYQRVIILMLVNL